MENGAGKIFSFIFQVFNARKGSPPPTPPAAGDILLFSPIRRKKEVGGGISHFRLGTLVSLFFILPVFYMQAQTPGWQWATGPVGQCTVAMICADANSNVYVTGHFLGNLSFNTDTLPNSTGAIQDVFIARYNAQGQPIWAKSARGYADANGISADENGNVFVVGTFYNDSITFGNQVLLNPNAGVQNSNIFLAKYDTTGNLIWAKNLGGINNDIATGISTDVTGNVYVTGSFIGDSLTLGNITLQHLAANDGFVAKFNPAGDALWLRAVGSAFLDGITGVSTGGSGDVFVTGYFLNNAIYIGNADSTMNSPFSNNVFVIKYDSSGIKKWAKYAGSNYGNGPGGIAADAQGNVYITGYFSDTVALDSEILAGNGFQNIFTAKYDASGTLMWAQSTGGTNVDQPNGIACDALGKAYITGYFQSDTIGFGSNYLVNPTGSQVTFLAQYDTFGRATFALAPGGTSDNTGLALCHSAGSVYLSGTFQSSDIIFGNDTLSNSQLNIFIAKTDTIAATTGIKALDNPGEDIHVFPNPSAGIFYVNGLTAGDRVEIFNLMGQSVLSAVSSGSIYSFNLLDRAKGVYLCRVTNTVGGVELGKIVVE